MTQERIKIGDFSFFVPVKLLKRLRGKFKGKKGFGNNRATNRTTNK
jgi:hypothetical protein